jgi:hypothetical protein
MAMPRLGRVDIDALYKLIDDVDDVRYVSIGELFNKVKVRSPRRFEGEHMSDTWTRLSRATEEAGTPRAGFSPGVGVTPINLQQRLGMAPDVQLAPRTREAGQKLREDILASQMPTEEGSAAPVFQLDNPIEINNGWVVDGNKRLAIIRAEFGDSAMVPVRKSTRTFDPKELADEGIVPNPQNADDILFADYLSTGLLPYSKDEIAMLLRQNGYTKLRQWADANDQFWDEFKNVWRTGKVTKPRPTPTTRTWERSLYSEPVPKISYEQARAGRGKKRVAAKKQGIDPQEQALIEYLNETPLEEML